MPAEVRSPLAGFIFRWKAEGAGRNIEFFPDRKAPFSRPLLLRLLAGGALIGYILITRLAVSHRALPPVEVLPPPSPRKYWTRKGIAVWLVRRLAEATPTLVGIDHGFSFPLRYFEAHGLKPDWPAFLDDFQRHWPTARTSTSTLFATACAATARCAWATLAGGG